METKISGFTTIYKRYLEQLDMVSHEFTICFWLFPSLLMLFRSLILTFFPFVSKEKKKPEQNYCLLSMRWKINNERTKITTLWTKFSNWSAHFGFFFVAIFFPFRRKNAEFNFWILVCAFSLYYADWNWISRTTIISIINNKFSICKYLTGINA